MKFAASRLFEGEYEQTSLSHPLTDEVLPFVSGVSECLDNEPRQRDAAPAIGRLRALGPPPEKFALDLADLPSPAPRSASESFRPERPIRRTPQRMLAKFQPKSGSWIS